MKKSAVMALILLLAMICQGCAGNKKISDTGFMLDTVVTITIYDGDEDKLNDAFDEIQRLENIFSITRPESDVSKVNTGYGWVQVPDELNDVLNKAMEIAELSDGAFDITIQPLIELWNVSGGGPVPDAMDIKNALARVGYKKLQINGDKVFADGKTQIHLGGVAKGYIADKVCERLKSDGVEHGIINLGGNVVVFGGNPNGNDFTVGIRDPFGSESDIVGIVSIKEGSVVTSGGYERYFEQNGEIYHHIIDPATGYPSSSGLSGVTILSQSSADGDALSTAVYILGANKGMALIESLDGIECVLITDEGELLLSSGMSEYFSVVA